MKVIYKKLPSRKVSCVATIGTFDGIHRGHQFILNKCKKLAKKSRLPCLSITFDLAPQQFLKKRNLHNAWPSTKVFSGAICDLEQKIALIQALNLDYLWLLKTSSRLLELKPSDFLNYIFRYLNIKHLIVGEDFRFGYAGRGDIKYLKKAAASFSFKLTVVPKLKLKSKIISSSLIRKFIKTAQLAKVKGFLGREFSLKGKVVKGKGVGRLLGFPTANLMTKDYVVPSPGVYAAYLILNKKKYLAGVNIEPTQSFKTRRKTLIEAHIINFHKNILGKTIEIVFIKKIRPERKFLSRQDLQKAIAKDIRRITAKYSIPA